VIDAIDRAYDGVPGNQYCTWDRDKPAAQRRPSEYRWRFSTEEMEAAFRATGFTLCERLRRGGRVPLVVYCARRS
jgi:hypothetical protein